DECSVRRSEVYNAHFVVAQTNLEVPPRNRFVVEHEVVVARSSRAHDAALRDDLAPAIGAVDDRELDSRQAQHALGLFLRDGLRVASFVGAVRGHRRDYGTRARAKRKPCTMHRRVATRGSVALLTAAMTLLAATSHAQPSEQDAAKARTLFVAGKQAADAGRWADAAESFEASFSLTHNPAALYNRAVALRALGRHVEARDAFAKLLSDPSSLDDDTRKSADAMRGEEAGRVASIVVSGIEGCRIQLDGKETPQTTIDVDPGQHKLRGDC